MDAFWLLGFGPRVTRKWSVANWNRGRTKMTNDFEFLNIHEYSYVNFYLEFLQFNLIKMSENGNKT